MVIGVGNDMTDKYESYLEIKIEYNEFCPKCGNFAEEICADTDSSYSICKGCNKLAIMDACTCKIQPKWSEIVKQCKDYVSWLKGIQVR